MIPVRIDNHIYYRRTDNLADNLTLYRFPVDQLAEWHDFANAHQSESDDDMHSRLRQKSSLLSQVPPYPHDPDLNESLTNKEKEEAKARFANDYPEQKVFCLRDLERLYQ